MQDLEIQHNLASQLEANNRDSPIKHDNLRHDRKLPTNQTTKKTCLN